MVNYAVAINYPWQLIRLFALKVHCQLISKSEQPAGTPLSVYCLCHIATAIGTNESVHVSRITFCTTTPCVCQVCHQCEVHCSFHLSNNPLIPFTHKLASLLGYACSVNEQCTLKVPNSECTDGRCQCDPSFMPLRRDKCLPG